MPRTIAVPRRDWTHLRELLGVRVPRDYARGIYEHLLVHMWIFSEEASRDVGHDAAARDWLAHYHWPAMALLASHLPGAGHQTLSSEYLRILDHL
jgi:hypothetical protein